jgi:hypothetical protein
MPYSQKLIVVFVLFAMAISLIICFAVDSQRLKIDFIKLTSSRKWSEFQRLTRLLHVGMPEHDAEEILGKPNFPTVTESNIQVWVYVDTGPTATWSYVAEFSRAGSNRDFELCYIANIENPEFPEAGWYEMGKRIPLAEPEETFTFGYLRSGYHKNYRK